MSKKTDEIKEVKILVGTYQGAAGNRAYNLVNKIKTAGIDGFAVKPADDVPGFIQVIGTRSEDAAEQTLAELKKIGINAVIA